MTRDSFLLPVLAWFAFLAVWPVAPATSATQPLFTGDTSFQNEIQRAIDRGLAWLQANQNTNGYWSTPDQPAVTALTLMAFKGEPKGRFQNEEPSWIKRGYAFILSCAKPDGGIHQSNLVTYNTSISMMALL